MENFVIRPITKEDVLETEKLATLAWLNPCDLEKDCDPETFNTDGMMGLVTPENEIAAYITEIPFESNFDGHKVGMNGISCVGTKPEYRYGGAIRRLFAKVFENSAQRGQVFSVLFPFSHKFYRKMGYESFSYRHSYTIENDMLTALKVTSPLRRIEEGEELELINSIHSQFTQKYNLAVTRTLERAKYDNRGDTYKDLVSHFIIGDGAYVSYKLSRFNPSEINVTDWAVTDEKYIPEILGLFGRYSPMIKTVQMTAPPDIVLEAYVDAAAKLTHTVNYGPMVRVLDVEKALRLAANPLGADFTIAVEDDGIEANNATWHVFSGGVEKTDAPPDVRCDIRAFAPMILGSYAINCAKARADVCVNGNLGELEKFFTEKKIYLDDSF